MTEVVLAFLSVTGALVGVMLGSLLNARMQRASWEHQESTMSIRDRRATYAAFVAACREWRATVLGPEVAILPASSVSRQPHADGGQARVQVVRYRAEIGLIAHTTATLQAAAALMLAVGRLSEARAGHEVGEVPEPFIEACRDAEREFNRVARAELRSPEIHLRTPTGLPPEAGPEGAREAPPRPS
ncbi:hypothetical protein [Actinoplanes regularis]|uniref:Uncharacterized protein n=1 Tax=Actinoplanes regularis TaxID=52697 RepID=A0A238YTP2_9ACTN|nr:hypothetical protein [Actinoplanes regularis]GIE85514.1 hypothetical protein Are01nite_19940 [Actinoplanes regularis]SNR73829.1 hypothetical protein SAMN06264365_105135 [Actinoplanes regularis]